MTESRARRDLDFDYVLDDPDHDGWFGQAQAADPGPAPEVDVVEPDDAHDSGWDDPRDSRWDRLYAPRNGQNGAARIGEWTFSVSRPQPWYRKKHVRTG